MTFSLWKLCMSMCHREKTHSIETRSLYLCSGKRPNFALGLTQHVTCIQSGKPISSRSTAQVYFAVSLRVCASTWRNCDSPHRLSTAFWPIYDSAVWIPLCFRTAPSFKETQMMINKRQKRSLCAVLVTCVKFCGWGRTSPGLILI